MDTKGNAHYESVCPFARGSRQHATQGHHSHHMLPPLMPPHTRAHLGNGDDQDGDARDDEAHHGRHKGRINSAVRCVVRVGLPVHRGRHAISR